MNEEEKKEFEEFLKWKQEKSNSAINQAANDNNATMEQNSVLQTKSSSSKLGKGLGCGCLGIILFLVFLALIGQSGQKQNESNTSDGVEIGGISETQAIAIGCQFVEINVPGAKDFSQKKADRITDVQNAFYVQGHFVVNGVEYKFGVPVHYTGGEWSAHRNWEWAKMEIVQVGTVNLKELHGTWNYSMF